MRVLLISSSLLIASVAQAGGEGLFHYSASLGSAKAYSDAGLQLEVGAGPISIFGATGYQWSQGRANFAAGLKGWLDDRRHWSANAQFQWSSLVPAQTLDFGIDRSYTLSFGL